MPKRKPPCFGLPITACGGACHECPHLDACAATAAPKTKGKQHVREGVIVEAAIKALNKLPGCRVKKHHGSVFGKAEVDVYGCINGRALFLEAKRPGEKPTPRQVRIMEEWRACGAITGVFHSVEEALALVLIYSL